MLPLADVHAALRHALVYGESLPPELRAALGQQAEVHFDIHRNHFFHSVTAAIENTFPAIVSLVDKRFFSYCAHEYIQANPPHAPCLFEYGESFPAFLSQFPPCKHLSYLAGVAWLEWNIHAVFHASDGAGAQSWERSRGGLPTHVRLMESPYPVHRIWHAALDPASPSVDAADGPARLVIYRNEGDSAMQHLSEAAFKFLKSVAGGAGPLVALGEASRIDPSYSLGGEIPAVVMSDLYGRRSLTQQGDHHV